MKKFYREDENTPTYAFVSLLFWTYSFLDWYLTGNTMLELIFNILSPDIMELGITQRLWKEKFSCGTVKLQERVTVVLEGTGVQVISLFLLVGHSPLSWRPDHQNQGWTAEQIEYFV